MSYPGVEQQDFAPIEQPRMDAPAEFQQHSPVSTIKDNPPSFEEIPPVAPINIPTENREKRRKKLGADRGAAKKKHKELVLPSEDDCKVRPLEIEDLMEAGLLGQLDSFSKKLFPNKLDPAGRPVEEDEEADGENFWQIIEDDEKRETFMSMAEKIICLGVVDPIVRPRDWEPELTDDEISFSWIRMGDKLFLFNYFMAPINGIATFR